MSKFPPRADYLDAQAELSSQVLQHHRLALHDVLHKRLQHGLRTRQPLLTPPRCCTHIIYIRDAQNDVRQLRLQSISTQATQGLSGGMVRSHKSYARLRDA